jgi:Domain of unknown function (DUF4082)
MPVKKSPREPIPGQIVIAGSLVTPGGEQGIPGPSAVSKDVGNVATIGSDGFIYVPAGSGGGGGGVITEYTLGHVAPQHANTGGGYTFGIMFSVSENGYLKEVSWYKTADEASTVNHSFIIWDEANVPIWNSPPDDDPAVEGWITHSFAIPMPLSAGNYRLGMYAANGYGTADAYYPHVDGPLSSESGCYIEGNGCPINSAVAFYCFDLVFLVSAVGGGGGGTSTQIIQSADEATAIADSLANPNNIYYWIILPPPPVLTSLNPTGGGGTLPNPGTVQAIGSGFTAQCVGLKDGADITTAFVSATELTLTFNYSPMFAHTIWIKDQYGQASNTVSWHGGPM